MTDTNQIEERILRRLGCPAPRCMWMSGLYHMANPDLPLDQYHRHYLKEHIPKPKVYELPG